MNSKSDWFFLALCITIADVIIQVLKLCFILCFEALVGVIQVLITLVRAAIRGYTGSD